MLKATTQYCIISALLPLTRRYHTYLISQLLRRLSCKFYTDKLFEKHKYIIGNACAQIFTDRKRRGGTQNGQTFTGITGTWEKAKGGKMWERTFTGNGSRRTHAVWGAGIRNKWWRLTGRRCGRCSGGRRFALGEEAGIR